MPKFLHDGHFSGSSTDLTVDGNLHLANHVIPTADNTVDLGTTDSKDFRTLYIREIDVFNQRLRISYSGTIATFRDHSSVGDGFEFFHRGTSILRLGDGGETEANFAGDIIAEGGTLQLGGDVSLFRDGTNILRTDDALHANGHIHVGGVSGGGSIYNRADTSNNITFSSTGVAVSQNLTLAATKSLRYADDKIAIGNVNETLGSEAISIGYDAEATGNQSIAIGYNPQASATYSVAIGYNVKATGQNTFVFGTSGTHSDTNTLVASGLDLKVTGTGTSTFAGSVGIKTPSSFTANSSADDLVVGSGSGSQGITIYSGSGKSSAIYFADDLDEEGAGDSPAGNRDGVIKYEHANSRFNIRTAGNQDSLILTNTSATFNGNVVVGNALYVPNEIYHTGDTNTSIRFPAQDQFRVMTGGGNRLQVENTKIQVGDDVNMNYDSISTGNSGTVVYGGFLNPASEANMVHLPHVINDLAGFNKWSNATITTSGFYQTRSGSAGSYTYSNEVSSSTSGWANAFDAHSSTAGSWYSDNGSDGVYTHGVDTPGVVELQWTNEATYSLWAGIVFGSFSFTATYVKIEAYRGGAWQTLCEITNNTDQVILRQVGSNSGTGAATTRLKYTLGGSVNGSYFRIHSLYMANYRAGDNNLNNTGTDTTRGVNFLERYKNNYAHGHLFPGAHNTYDLGGSSYKWKNVIGVNIHGDLVGTINSSTTANTQSQGNNSTKVATTAYVDTAVSNLVDSAPATLDTLNELAAALGDDANFSTTVTNSIAGKVSKSGDTMTGSLTIGSDTNEKDFKVYGNDSGELLQWLGSQSKLRINHDTDDAGLEIFTVGSAQPTSHQVKIGRDSGQYLGIRVDDGRSYIIHRQDESGGGDNHHQTNQIWTDGGGTHTWNWDIANSSGGSPSNKMQLNSSGALSLAGNLTASNFSGSSSGTNTGDQDLSAYITQTNADARYVLETGGSSSAMTGDLHIISGGPKIILQDNTDDDDQVIIFRNNGGTDEYKIATADFTGGGGGDGFYIGSTTSDGEIGLVTANTTALTLDTSQNATFAGTTTSTKVNINQAADEQGLEIKGYDDHSSSDIKLQVNGSGHARLSQTTDGGSGYLFLQAENYLNLQAGTLIYTQNQLRIYDSGSIAFGSGGDFVASYNSGSDEFRLMEATSGTKGLKMNTDGKVTFTEDVTSQGYLQSYGHLYLRNNIRLLNKNSDGWVNFAQRDITGSEAVYNVSGVGTISASGAVTAGSFVKSGGTSSQFLMADGSVSTGGGGTIDGSGSANKLAIWSDSDTLTSDVNIVNNGGQLQLGNGLLVEDNDTTVITAKAYEPHIVWQKTRGSSGDDFFKIKAENDAMAVDFTTARDGGSDTRVLRIDSNNNFVFSTNGSYTQLHSSFMSVYGRLTSSSDIRSTQYYDYNDTTRYLDLNSTGTSLRANGTVHASNSNMSSYQLNGTYVMDSSRNLVNIGTIGSGAINATGNVTADAFYDRNNTAYFLNPAGDSTLYNAAGTFFRARFQASTNLTAGWYTIAAQGGSRAQGRFRLVDRASSRHQAVEFLAAHHYGNNDSNTITVLDNGTYSTDVFRYLRIKEAGTYDGAVIQVYIDNSTNNCRVILEDQAWTDAGWVLKNFVADATDPGDVGNYSALSEQVRVDLDDIKYNGGITSTGKAHFNRSVVSEDSVKGTQFIDYDDSNYYLNPAATTTSLNVAGKIEMANNKPVEWDNGSIRAEGNTLKLVAATLIDLQDNTQIQGNLDVTTGVVEISQAATNLLTLTNTSNGGGAGVVFNDNNAGSQRIYLRGYHADGSSQGGGASLHLQSTEADLVFVVGDSSNTGRIVVKSHNSNSEVDYGFYSDTNTGMYSPGAGQVGLVSDGSRKLLVSSNGVTINNGNLYIPDHSLYVGNYIYHDGDTNTYIYFTSDNIKLRTGGDDRLELSASGAFFKNEVMDSDGQSIKGYRLNKATSSSWTAANTSNQTGWYGGNFNGSEITTKWVNGPHGERTLAAETDGDTGNDYDGGYVKQITNLDINKSHLSVVYVKRINSAASGNVYHGTGAGTNQITNLSNTSNTNPYFQYHGASLFPQDVWCVSIGVIQANNDSNTDTSLYTGSSALQGVYRCDTGQKIGNGHNAWKMGSAGSTLSNGIRFFHYYSTDANCKLQWAKPGFYEINGDEPTLSELLSGGASKGLHTNGGDVYAANYYDSNNTAYYLDPASTSVVNTVQASYFKASTGSTSDPILRLTDTGVANYDFIFPDTNTIKLETSTSSTKTFKLLNAGSGNFNFEASDADFTGDVTVTGNFTRTNRFSVTGDVNVIGATDLTIPTGRRFRLDGAGGHTYIMEEGDNNMKFYVGGTEHINVGGGDIYLQQPVRMTSYLYHTGNTGTSMQYETNSIKFRTNNSVRLTLNDSYIVAGRSIDLGDKELINTGATVFYDRSYPEIDYYDYSKLILETDSVELHSPGEFIFSGADPFIHFKKPSAGAFLNGNENVMKVGLISGFGPGMEAVDTTSANLNTDLHFIIQRGGSQYEAIKVTGKGDDTSKAQVYVKDNMTVSGKFGIGTTNPQSVLSVNGTSSLNGEVTLTQNKALVKRNAYYRTGGIRLQKSASVTNEVSMRYEGPSSESFIIEQYRGGGAKGHLKFRGSPNEVSLSASRINIGSSSNTTTYLNSATTNIPSGNILHFQDSRNFNDGLRFTHTGTGDIVQMGMYGSFGDERGWKMKVKSGTSTTEKEFLHVSETGSFIRLGRNIPQFRVGTKFNIGEDTTVRSTWEASVYGTMHMYFRQASLLSYPAGIFQHSGASGSTSANMVQFRTSSSGVVGRIISSGSSTTYQTSSDYRMKKNFKDFDGINLVDQMSVYDFNWKAAYDSDQSQSYGVKAHELKEVLPHAVWGEKDAVNEDGSVDPQGVDYSQLVPVLVKAVQELSAKVKELESKIQ